MALRGLKNAESILKLGRLKGVSEEGKKKRNN